MRYKIIENVDISGVEECSGIRTGMIRPVPTDELRQFSWSALELFMHKYGLYCFPTTELIEHLAGILEGGGSAIEIGCGLGVIGRALGIPITDSRMQEWPAIKQYYDLCRQPTIQYPADVEELDALAAVQKYHPDIVIGSYITHLWRPGMKTGNQYGVDTIQLINSVGEYYMIGNLNIHTKDDPAMKYLDGYEHHDFLVTRGDPSKAVIFRWRNPKFQKHISK